MGVCLSVAIAIAFFFPLWCRQEGAGVRCPECFTLALFDSVESVPLFDVDAAMAGGGGDGDLENGEEELG